MPLVYAARDALTRPPAGAYVDSSRPLSRGLRHWWPFNAGSGVLEEDVCAGGRMATMVGTPSSQITRGPFGGHSAAMKLDGSNGYLTCNGAGNEILSKSFSFSFWTWPLTHKNFGMYICVGTGFGTSGWYIDQSSTSGGMEFVTNEPGSVTSSISSAVVPINTRWVHLGGILRNGTFEFYVDGIRQTLGLTGAHGVAATGTQTYLGNDGAFGSLKLNGYLDNVKLWDRALSPAEMFRDFFRPFECAMHPKYMHAGEL